jgi:cobalt-zinc-cadmium efflux system protein
MIHFENIEKKKQFIALLISLIMNIVVFLAEVILGYLINSLNIIADGVDSFGDSISYSVAIYSFFSLNNKSKDDAGMIIAIVQVFSAAFIFEEILRGILTENSVAEYFYGFIITIVSLVVNVVSAFLLYKASHKELNMKAAFIFSFMDI